MKDYTLGQKIKMYRERADMSQMELELEIGASPGSISRIENGKTNPTKETILAIGYVLGLEKQEVGYLLGTVDEYNPPILIDYNLKFDSEKIVSLKHNELMKLVESSLNSVGTGIVSVDWQRKKIRLMSISDSVLSWFSMPLVLKSKAFRELDLDEAQTLTKKSVIESKTIFSNRIVEFVCPPLSTTIAQTIIKLIKVKSMASIPVKQNSKVIGAFVVGIREEVNPDTERKLLDLEAKLSNVSQEVAELFQ